MMQKKIQFQITIIITIIILMKKKKLRIKENNHFLREEDCSQKLFLQIFRK